MQMTDRRRFTFALAISVVIVAILYVGATVTLTKLVENRGVSDDVCYLRQSLLFRNHGWIGGLDTDSAEARYIAGKFRELKLPERYTPFLNCERQASGGHVLLQYPFATGFLLSFFPPFAQSSWLYIASATLVFMLVCGALLSARSMAALVTVAVAGGANVYMMVNPAKSSYSIAPTMPVCIVLGLATVWMFAAKRVWQRVLLAGAAGFLVGVATDLRLSSSLLAFGFAATFAVQFLARRNWENFLRPLAFGLACLAALAPLIASNVINGGSPFATGYRGQDTQLPDLSLAGLRTMFEWYGLHTHGLLLWSALALLAALVIKRRAIQLSGVNAVIGIAASNLIFNMGFFLTHPVPSQYYTIPPTILTIWTIVFAWHASERNRTAETASHLVPARIRTWSAAALACGLAVYMFAVMAPGLARKAPPGPTTVALEANALVWTAGETWQNPIARALEIYLDRHAVAEFDTAPVETVDALLASIAKDGRPQYFVVQNPAMDAIAKRAAAFGKVDEAGKIFGVPTYRLQAAR
jgi:hypothetical protein